MLNWSGELPDADAVLRVAGGHWHDYGQSPRQGRKVGHATVRCDTATDLMQVLRRIGQSLGRQDQVAPVVAALAGAPACPIQIGRAHVCNTITNAHLVCRSLLVNTT